MYTVYKNIIMDSENSMKDYYNASCTGCFSKSSPYDPGRVSLTDINGITGASEYASKSYPTGGDIQGAQIHNVIRYRVTPKCGIMPYEKDVTYEHIVPWWGQPMEGTYMNALKRKAEGEVPTYRDLKLTPISGQKTATYVPEIYTKSVEGFCGLGKNNLILIVALIALIICMNKK